MFWHLKIARYLLLELKNLLCWTRLIYLVSGETFVFKEGREFFVMCSTLLYKIYDDVVNQGLDIPKLHRGRYNSDHFEGYPIVKVLNSRI